MKTRKSKKRILITIANLIPPRGGAERSTLTLAQSLAKDFEVIILTPHDKYIIKEENGYTLIAIKKPFYFKFLKSFFKINMLIWWWNKVLKEFLKQEEFDFISIHGVIVPAFHNLKTNAKKVLLVRGFPAFTPNVDEDPMKIKDKYFRHLPFIFKIQYPLIRFFQKKGLKTLHQADILLSNSDYTRRVTKFYTGKDSPIIYPQIRIEDYKIKSKKNQEYILFMSLITSPEFPTTSGNPPLSETIEGIPLTIASAGVLPKGSYQLTGLTKRYVLL